ncbi:MAG: class I SAM-dependent methyltransferase [bacterium]
MTAHCRICGSETVSVALKVKSYDQLWDIHECSACTGRFILMKGDLDLERFYSEHYDMNQAWLDRLKNPANGQRQWRRQWMMILSGLDPGLAPHRALDVGCAGGHFLINAPSGWERTGIELAPPVAEIARANGIHFLKKPIEEITEIEDNSLSVVGMFAVIEHLIDPHSVLERIKALMKPGGVLAVMTADCRSWKARWKSTRWHMYSPPQHQFFFSRKALLRMLETHGFRNYAWRYTDGGMTQLGVPILDKVIYKGMRVVETFPGIRTLPLFDHLFTYNRLEK